MCPQHHPPSGVLLGTGFHSPSCFHPPSHPVPAARSAIVGRNPAVFPAGLMKAPPRLAPPPGAPAQRHFQPPLGSWERRGEARRLGARPRLGWQGFEGAGRHLGKETESGGSGQCDLVCLGGAVRSLRLPGAKAPADSRAGLPQSGATGTQCIWILRGRMKMQMPGLQPRSPNQTRRVGALESAF